MTGLERFARGVEKAIPQVVRAANDASKLSASMGVDFAKYFSSGTTPTSLLSRPVSLGGFGAPYGHGSTGWLGPRGPIPYGAPWIINEQSGEFRDDWITYVKAKGIGAASGLLTYGIKNVAPYASYLQFGTKRMIARPLDKALRAYLLPVHTKNLYDALKPILTEALEGR